MAKLSTLKPRLQALGSRLSAPPAQTRQQSEQERFRTRDVNITWRKWYGTARWKKLRIEVWLRDAYTCQKTGVICLGKYPADNSPVADHKIQHHGDPGLFWDAGNIQTVSKGYHDSHKQREERSNGW